MEATGQWAYNTTVIRTPSQDSSRLATSTLLLCALLWAACTPSAPGPDTAGDLDPQAYFRGQTITITIPWSAGSGIEAHLRPVLTHLRDSIPGNPAIQIINRSGAAGVAGTNYWYRRAKPDGLDWLFTGGLVANQVLKDISGANYDVRRMIPIGSIADPLVMYGNQERLPRGIRDIFQRQEPLYTGMRTLSGSTTVLLSGLSLLGPADVQSVQFPGGSVEQRPALLRGEIDVASDSTTSFLKIIQPEIDRGAVVPLWQSGRIQDGKLVPYERVPDVPTILEAYRQLTGQDLAGDFLRWAEVGGAIRSITRIALLPSETPAPIVRVLREAWWESVHHPLYEQAITLNGVPLTRLSAEEAQQSIDKVLSISQEMHDFLVKYYRDATD